MDGTCEAELVHLYRICGSSGIALDIGANRGTYSYRLSKRFAHVVSFEINDELTGWLAQYNPGNIEIIHCGLSSSTGTATLYIPVMRGMLLEGWGSLERGHLEGAAQYREKQVKIARLDDFEITDIGFVKMDVEGHEVEVLKGAAATIARSRPIVLIEVLDRNFQTVDAWFLAQAYRRCSLAELLGLSAKPETENSGNYIYIPNERLAEFGLAAAK